MKIFTKTEEIIYALRGLYESYGYRLFKMNKFEEYSFYMEHKNFLTTENIISFGDLDGRLLALKPDITLSIAKNARDGENSRVYYNENVYRASHGIHEYKEIPQVGLEYIGDTDEYAECETVLLAVRSMELLNKRYTLDISHMGFVSSLLSYYGFSENTRADIITSLRKKDAEGIFLSCIKDGASKEDALSISHLADVYGNFKTAIDDAEKLSVCKESDKALSELGTVYSTLSSSGYGDNINLDFSIINDMNYYNGIVFQGYLENVPKNVLSGGRYDKLLSKLGKKSGACGFAVYLDLIELYGEDGEEKEPTVVVIYDDNDDIPSVMRFADGLRKKSERVTVVKSGTDFPDGAKVFVFKESGKAEKGRI